MAESTCVKCGNTVFEFKPVKFTNSIHQYQFVQCATCGGVIAMIESHNASHLLAVLDGKVTQLLLKP